MFELKEFQNDMIFLTVQYVNFEKEREPRCMRSSYANLTAALGRGPPILPAALAFCRSMYIEKYSIWRFGLMQCGIEHRLISKTILAIRITQYTHLHTFMLPPIYCYL